MKPSFSGRPVPTPRALRLAALGLLPAALATLAPTLLLIAAALNGLLLLLIALDFLLAPRARDLELTRTVDPVLSSGRPHPVTLELVAAPGIPPITGSLRDLPEPGPLVHNHHQPFHCSGRATATWTLTPLSRGSLRLGDVWLRLVGPLGLCARQVKKPLATELKVYPNLTAVAADALSAARASGADARRVVLSRGEGREFESLREYRAGDDPRTLDWKATARRARPMVRLHQPERNQLVWIFLDCGRHMAGTVGPRRKLDLAVDAALRLAKVALDSGDFVGLVAYGTALKAIAPPGRGLAHLRHLAAMLAEVEASLEESDVALAMEAAFAKHKRRALVVLMTDLLDVEASRSVVARVQRLTPRHLPLVISLADDQLHEAAGAVPADRQAAHVRWAARQLEAEANRAVNQLREAGARVLRARPSRLSGEAVSSYLELKARGAL